MGYQLVSHDPQRGAWMMVIIIALVGACFDVKTKRIPNALVLTSFAVGLIWSLSNGGWFAVLPALGGCCVTAIPFLFLYAFMCGGAGDAKLMGSLGFWLGPHDALVLLCSVLVMGGLEGIVFAIIKKRGSSVFNNFKFIAYVFFMKPSGLSTLKQQHQQMNDSGLLLQMPYGLAIWGGSCLGAIGTWLWHW